MGVKAASNETLPAAGIVPDAGVYVKVPGTEAVGSNCVALSRVP